MTPRREQPWLPSAMQSQGEGLGASWAQDKAKGLGVSWAQAPVCFDPRTKPQDKKKNSGMRVHVQRSNWIEQQHCRNARRAWSGAANVQIKVPLSGMCCKPHGATNLQCYRRIVFVNLSM